MKLHIRFWDESEDTVATRHYSSELLGKAGSIAEKENDISLIR